MNPDKKGRIFGIMRTLLVVLLLSVSCSWIHAQSVEKLVLNGNKSFEEGKFEEAISYYNDALDSERDNLVALFNRGKAYYQIGQFDAALEDLNNTISIEPGWSEARLERAYLLMEKNYPALAVKDLDKIIKSKKIPDGTFLLRARAGMDLKEEKLVVMDFLNKEIDLNGESAEAWYFKGLVRAKDTSKSAIRAALMDVSTAIRLAPEDPGYLYFSAILKAELSDIEDAKEDLNAALILYPEYLVAYMTLAELSILQQKPDEAINAYSRAIQVLPKEPTLYYNRGTTYLNMSGKEKLELAEKDFSKAIELFPSYADAFCNRGLSRSLRGNDKDAVSDFDMAVGLDPTDAHFYFLRGLSLHKTGNTEEACADLNYAITLGHSSAREELENICN